MKREKELLWIQEGYCQVSQNGFKNIKIEILARSLNKNKSSFYHYFGDAEIFETELLNYHIREVEKFANEALKCKSLKPDILKLFVKHKTDLFFHKQLRINRDNPEHKKCFEKAFKKVDEAIIDKWSSFLAYRISSFLQERFYI